MISLNTPRCCLLSIRLEPWTTRPGAREELPLIPRSKLSGVSVQDYWGSGRTSVKGTVCPGKLRYAPALFDA